VQLLCILYTVGKIFRILSLKSKVIDKSILNAICVLHLKCIYKVFVATLPQEIINAANTYDDKGG